MMERRVTFINSDPSAIAESATHMPNPLDPNAPPIRIKKKPGRKPNPASPALRKAQNRAAQRAFRERKERHVKELEDTIAALKNNKEGTYNQLKCDLQEKQTLIDSLKAENVCLKNVVLSLQMTLTQNGLQLPSSAIQELNVKPSDLPSPCNLDLSALDSGIESPGLSSACSDHGSPPLLENPANSFEDILSTIPIDNPVMSPKGYLDTTTNGFALPEQNSAHSPDFLDPRAFLDLIASQNQNSFIDNYFPQDFSNEMSLGDPLLPMSMPMLPGTRASPLQVTNGVMVPDPRPLNYLNVPPDNVSALQLLKMQILLQETSKKSLVPITIKPTFLQMNVPHDPRIDLVPCSGLRDRMIIFRDQYDMNAVTDLLIKKSVFHGGDPTDPSCWELPDEFFDKFWFLCVNVNAERTNRWRKARGAPVVHLRHADEEMPVSKMITQV